MGPLNAAFARCLPADRGAASFLRTVRVCLLVVVAAFAPLPIRAHDLYEVWANAVIRADELEVLVTMASITGLRLIDPEMKTPPITPETLAKRLPDLRRAGGALFTISAGKTVLTPRTVEVELTEEYDLVFRVAYPRPPAGPLRLHGAFIAKLGEGYGGILDVGEATGNHLGWEQLSPRQPSLEVIVPERK